MLQHSTENLSYMRDLWLLGLADYTFSLSQPRTVSQLHGFTNIGRRPSTIQFLNQHQKLLWRITSSWKAKMTKGNNDNNLPTSSRAPAPTEEVLSTAGLILQFWSIFCRQQ